MYYSKTNDGVNEGKKYLIANAKAAWDFTALQGGLNDLAIDVPDFSSTHDAVTLSGVFTPKVGPSFIDSTIFRSALCLNSNSTKQAFITALPSTTLFNSSFEVHLLFRVANGVPAGDLYLIGVENGNGQTVMLTINSAGKIVFQLNIQAGVTSTWTTDMALPSGQTSPIYVRLRVDFETDIFKIWVNGMEKSTTLVGSAITETNPSGFTCPYGIGIGGVRNGATSIKSGANSGIMVFKAAITPLLSDINAAKVGHYISYLK